MIDFLKHVLGGQNQFASGGLLLMIIGAIAAYLRSIPKKLWYWVESQFSMMITVKDDDMAFRWVKEWMLEQKYLQRARRVDLDTTLRGTELAMVPAPGRHWFWHAGRPFWVWFYRSDEAQSRTQRRMESLTFQTIGRDRRFLKAFVHEIVTCHKKKVSIASYLYVYDEVWSYVEAYSPRLLDSVILRPGEKEHLIRDVEKFRSSRKRYRQLGVPYHRGYLLYGPPGTGKTSLVSALASKFGMSVYAVNLTEFNDKSLRSAINDVPEHSMILLEDIDCMKAGNRRADSENGTTKQAPDDDGEKNSVPAQLGVTLSGLLNVLDGFHAPENVLFVMTTNKVEALDPALLRPGRIDYKLYMGEAAKSQKIELYRRFFPKATELHAIEFAEAHFAETMAQFQGLLLALEQVEGGMRLVSAASTPEAVIADASVEEPVLEQVS
jgi:mitochondrial chaperone BCS1